MDLLRVYKSVDDKVSTQKLEEVARATFYSDLAGRIASDGKINEEHLSKLGVNMPFLMSDAEIPQHTWDLPVAELLHKTPRLLGDVAKRLRGLRLSPFTRSVVWRLSLGNEERCEDLNRVLKGVLDEGIGLSVERLVLKSPVTNLLESMCEHLFSTQLEPNSWPLPGLQGGVNDLKPLAVRVMNLGYWLLKTHDADLMMAVIVVCAGCRARTPHVEEKMTNKFFGCCAMLFF